MTLKATIEECTRAPEVLALSISLVKARKLYIDLATKRERDECKLAEQRLKSARTSTDSIPQHQAFRMKELMKRREERAGADLRDALAKLLEASARAAEEFDKITK